jgi:hypothetical protein
MRSTIAALNAVKKLILNADNVRADSMISQNWAQVRVKVFKTRVDKGISTMRLRYKIVNPIVIPNPGMMERAAFIAARTPGAP